jgi:hypothetical protein
VADGEGGYRRDYGGLGSGIVRESYIVAGWLWRFERARPTDAEAATLPMAAQAMAACDAYVARQCRAVLAALGEQV